MKILSKKLFSKSIFSDTRHESSFTNIQLILQSNKKYLTNVIGNRYKLFYFSKKNIKNEESQNHKFKL